MQGIKIVTVFIVRGFVVVGDLLSPRLRFLFFWDVVFFDYYRAIVLSLPSLHFTGQQFCMISCDEFSLTIRSNKNSLIYKLFIFFENCHSIVNK